AGVRPGRVGAVRQADRQLARRHAAGVDGPGARPLLGADTGGEGIARSGREEVKFASTDLAAPDRCENENMAQYPEPLTPDSLPMPQGRPNNFWYVLNPSDTAIVLLHGIFSDSRG